VQISGLQNTFLRFRSCCDVREQKKDWRMFLSFCKKERLDRNLCYGTGKQHLKRPYCNTIKISRPRKTSSSDAKEKQEQEFLL